MTYCIFLKFDEICVSKFPHILEITWIMQFWPYTKNDVKTWYIATRKVWSVQWVKAARHQSASLGFGRSRKFPTLFYLYMFVNKQSWLEILGGLLDVFPIGKAGGSVAILVYSQKHPNFWF